MLRFLIKEEINSIKERRLLMKISRKILRVSTGIAIVLAAFSLSGISSAQVTNQALANSFSQYFSPPVLQAVDRLMETKYNCQSQLDDLWRIWTYGFHKKFKGPEGRVEVILNWDGKYYIRNFGPETITGDWTKLK